MQSNHNKEKSHISVSQYGALVICMVLGTQIMVPTLEHGLGRNSWLGVLFAVAGGLLLVWFYFFWGKQFGGMAFDAILLQTWGKIAGSILLILLILQLVFSTAAAAWYISDFWRSLDMRDTPRDVYILAVFILAASLCHCGVSNLARFCFISAAVVGLLVALNLLFFIPSMDASYFLPIGNIPPKEFLAVGIPVFFAQYGDVFFCLPFLYHLRQPGKGGSYMAKAIVVAAIILLVQVCRNIACLGEAISLYTYPILQVLRLFDSSQMLSMGELFGVGALVMVNFARLSICFYVEALLFTGLFHLEKRSPFILVPMVLIAAVVSSGIFGSNTDEEFFLLYLYPYVSAFFCFVVPLGTLLTAKFRHIRWEG